MSGKTEGGVGDGYCIDAVGRWVGVNASALKIFEGHRWKSASVLFYDININIISISLIKLHINVIGKMTGGVGLELSYLFS